MKLGIDIGGSHIAIALFDKLNIIKKNEIDLNKEENIKSQIEKSICDFIEEIKNKYQVECVGIAAPGSIVQNKIKFASNLEVADFDIINLVKKYLDVPVFIKNDAKCSAIAEKEVGSLKEYDNSIFLCIGTGIGGAVFSNNKLLEPKKYPGYEVGHMIIEKDGNECKCGKKGCFETYASITALKKKICAEFKIEEEITGKDLLEFIEKNKEKYIVKEILNDYINDLAIGISNLINIFEPEAICIGGSLSYYKELIFEQLEHKLKESNLLFNKEVPKLLVAKNKNDAGLIGATLLSKE